MSELLGMCELLNEVGVRVEAPLMLHTDKHAVIKHITGEDSSGIAKHIAIRHKFVKLQQEGRAKVGVLRVRGDAV